MAEKSFMDWRVSGRPYQLVRGYGMKARFYLKGKAGRPVSTRTRLRNEGLNLDTSSPEVSYSPYGRREDGVNGLKERR
jgi:hypothetical protein